MTIPQIIYWTGGTMASCYWAYIFFIVAWEDWHQATSNEKTFYIALILSIPIVIITFGLWYF